MALYSASLAAYISNKAKYTGITFCLIFALLSYIIAPLSPFFSTAEFFIPFIFGYFYTKHNGLNKINIRLDIQIIIALSLLAFGLFTFFKCCSITNQFYLLNINQAFETGKVDIIILRQITAISLSVTLFILIQLSSKSYNFISTIGAMTFGIYPIHAEIIGIVKAFSSPTSLNNPILDTILVLFIGFILMCISIYLVQYIRKSRYMKLILLGE